jgi:hypothetical protein
MPGKWTFLRNQGLEVFKQEETWQQQIDVVKKTFRRASDGCMPTLEEVSNGQIGTCKHGIQYEAMSKLELCQEIDDTDNEKDAIEAKLKAINTRREALNQLVLAILEDDGDTKISNAYGTFYIQDEPYTRVENKRDYLAWIREKKLEDLLTVPWQSTNAQAKDLLQKGQDPPPGLKIFIKSTVKRRNA